MKRQTALSLLLAGVVLACLLFFGAAKQPADPDFLRIHIRADSDEPAAQDVKYLVKDAVVNALAPYLADCRSKADAVAAVGARIPDIERTADEVLAEHGFSYTAHARVATEEFPQRTYRDLTLPAGVYDALILDLGSGSGQNWWCVVYPPLCFVNYRADGSSGVTYRSKLVEIVRNFFEKREEEGL